MQFWAFSQTKKSGEARKEKKRGGLKNRAEGAQNFPKS